VRRNLVSSFARQPWWRGGGLPGRLRQHFWELVFLLFDNEEGQAAGAFVVVAAIALVFGGVLALAWTVGGGGR